MGAFSFEELERLFEQGAALIDSGSPASRPTPAHQDQVRMLELAHSTPAPRGPGPAAELPVRPATRATVPILTVLDDGSLDIGEEIRIRRAVFTIGRTEGDLTMPNDPTISSRHAEIRLVSYRGLPAWLLRDQGSTNGTFARVNTARLDPDCVVILGARRYQLRTGSAAATAVRPASAVGATCQFAVDPPPRPAADALIEINGRAAGPALELRAARVTIGRDPVLSTIPIDDAGLAAVHAELVAEPDGGWRIIAKATRNGVWVSTQSMRLSACCYFQCGEQRFRFVVP